MAKIFSILLGTVFVAASVSEWKAESESHISLQKREQQVFLDARASNHSNRSHTRRAIATKTGSICGTITYMPGAKGFHSRGISTGINVYKVNRLIASIKSDSSGNYIVRHLPPGEYKVAVEEFELNTTVIVKKRLCSRRDITIRAPIARPR